MQSDLRDDGGDELQRSGKAVASLAVLAVTGLLAVYACHCLTGIADVDQSDPAWGVLREARLVRARFACGGGLVVSIVAFVLAMAGLCRTECGKVLPLLGIVLHVVLGSFFLLMLALLLSSEF